MTNKKDLIVLAGAFTLIFGIIVGFSIKYIGEEEQKSDVSTEGNAPETKELIPLFSPTALRIKKEKNEPFEVIDVRPRILYEEEHLLDSKHLEGDAIALYGPKSPETQIIIIAPAENDALRSSINTIFKERGFSYAFLDGGLPGWKSIGGNTVSRGNLNSFVDRSKVSPITAEDVKGIIENNETLKRFSLIDTRNESEYLKGHIPNSKNIPLGALEERRFEIPSGRQVIIYGNSDLEGFQGAVRLFDFNIFSPQALSGGFEEWEKKKFPLEK